MSATTAKTGILRLLRAFVRDRKGLSAIEFAFVFPVMAALYLGGSSLTQGIVIKRKLTLATRTIGDLTSQDANVNDAEMTAIFSAAAAVMQPYPETTMTLIVSSLKVDATGAATVQWSNTSTNGGASTTSTGNRAVGKSVTLPAGVNSQGYVILAEGTYNYVPTWGTDYVGTLKFTETFYLRPRRTSCVTRNSVACT